MNRFEEQMQKLKLTYDTIEVPESGREEMIFKMKQAQNQHKRSSMIHWVGGIAAALALMIALPNVNAGVAQALGDLPVVGGLFRIVTIRQYEYDKDGKQAEVDIPELETEGTSNAAEQVNKSVEVYADTLIDEFKTSLEEEGYRSLNVGYDVITDTDTWLTLKLWAVETQASAYETGKFYNIDKTTDQVVKLSDLFPSDSDFVTVLSDEVKAQMRQRNEEAGYGLYFIDSEEPEWDFNEIDPNQDYYFDEDGNLVLFFNEGDVAAGSAGTVEFTISQDVYQSLLK